MPDNVSLLALLTVLSSIPYVLAALGGTCSERSGVVNIALEGILLGGAFATAVIAHRTGNAWAGLAAGIVAGMLVSLLHSLLTVTLKVDQIISGLAINILVAGGTQYGEHLAWPGSVSRTIPELPSWTLVHASEDGSKHWRNLFDLINLLGRPIVLITLLLVFLVWILIKRTRFGLRLRAVGENPGACDTLGISVPRLRYSGVLLSGALAGLGGAWLAFNIAQFQHGMSAGRGYIAMAAVVCGKWNPLGAAAACLLFGFSQAFASMAESHGFQVPSQIIATLPYLLTMVAVAGFVGRARPPASLGIPYEK